MTLPSVGAAPRYVEELRIGGGYGSPDGGVDIDKHGNIASDGSLFVDGDIGAAGSIHSWKVYLGARDAWPAGTDGCPAPVQLDFNASPFYPSLLVIDFVPDADKYAKFSPILPTDYDGRPLELSLYWTATQGSSGHVRWIVNVRCFGDHDTFNTGQSNYFILTDVFNAQKELHVITAEITPADAAKGGVLALMLRRQGSHAEDTFNADARLIGVGLRYA